MDKSVVTRTTINIFIQTKGKIMSKLKFSDKKQFNQLTQMIHLIMSDSEKNFSLNQLRQEIANNQGYKSLQAYQASNYSTAEKLPKDHIVSASVTRNDLTFLTNSDCDILRGSPGGFNALGLEYQMNFDLFHPLTRLEEEFISDTRLEPFPYASAAMGYSVLYENKKYLFLEFEHNYCENRFEHQDLKHEAKSKHDKLLNSLIFAAKHSSGHVMHLDSPEEDNEDAGRYHSALLVPFVFASSVSENFYEWQDYLSRLFIGLQDDLFSDNNHITDEELSMTYENQGRKAFFNKEIEETNPHYPSSVNYHNWLDGWTSAKQDEE